MSFDITKAGALVEIPKEKGAMAQIHLLSPHGRVLCDCVVLPSQVIMVETAEFTKRSASHLCEKSRSIYTEMADAGT